MKAKKILLVMLAIVIFLILIFCIMLIMKLMHIQREEDRLISYAKANNLKPEYIKNEFVNKSDATRGQKYFNMIIKDFKNKNFDKLYANLNEDYKKKYFDTLDKFKKYALEKMPADIIYKKNAEEIIGDLFIYKVDIWDFSDSKFKKRKNMYFVIRERSLGLYEFSFSYSENVKDLSEINQRLTEEEVANKKNDKN